MSKVDGGPAFPFNHYGLQPTEHGMSMRDYFAAKAMQAAMTGASAGSEEALPMLMQTIARISYQMADAMLAAREVKP